MDTKRTKLNPRKILGYLMAFAMVIFSSNVSAQCENTSAYPSAAVVANASAAVQITTCNFMTEYCTISGLVAGVSYTLDIVTDSLPGYITVRADSSNGAVIAQGYSPLTWSPIDPVNHYVHWNVNDTCGTNTTCHVTTITGNAPDIPGCIDPLANNYDPSANLDDGSCTYDVNGCTDPTAVNFNVLANIDDGSCIYTCTAAPYSESFDAGLGTWTTANTGSGTYTGWYSGTSTPSSLTGPQAGDVTGGNFLYIETSSNGGPYTLTSECLDVSALAAPAVSFNYHMYGATMGTLDILINGNLEWTLSGDQGNQWNWAQVDLSAYVGTNITITFVGTYGTSFTGDIALDGISVDELVVISGCTAPIACNYDATATTDDGSCDLPSGCGDILYIEYDTSVTCSDPNACITLSVNGCTDPLAVNYNVAANIDDGSCVYGQLGCTDPNACNYDTLATLNDGSCIAAGCTDTLACNYDPAAGCDDGSCLLAYGCNDPTAFNFDSTATCDDGSCIPTILGCLDTTASNFDASLNVNTDDGSCLYGAIGCMDTLACNYDILALTDDGSCTYPQVGYDCAGNCLGISCYCAVSCNSNFTNVSFEHITNVTFAGINNSSAGIVGGPVDYTGLTGASVVQGNTESMSVTLFLSSPYTEYIYAWFDWNQNGDFSDPGEYYLVAGPVTTVGPHTGTITVPTTATLGTTRMRVMMDYANAIPDPCRSSTYGETEDYCVTVNPFVPVLGCTDPTACNYDALANTDDGSCIPSGCTDLTALNYDSLAGCDDGSCAYFCDSYLVTTSSTPATCFGGADGTATVIAPDSINGVALANTYLWSNGETTASASGLPGIMHTVTVSDSATGCSVTDSVFIGQGSEILISSLVLPTIPLTSTGSIDITVSGGVFPYTYIWSAVNNAAYSATTEDISLLAYDAYMLTVIDSFGCTGSWQGLVDEVIVGGCTDPTAFNYDPAANFNDSSCIPVILGCIDALACNLDTLANTDDGSCDYSCVGCTDPTALNYDSTMTIDDGSCLPGCGGGTSVTYTTLNNMGGNNNIMDTVPDFTYSAFAGSGNPVTIVFDPVAGVMETCCDNIYIYDENGVLLNSSPYIDVSGQTFSAAGSINIEFDSDGSVVRTLEWTVYCDVVSGCMDSLAWNYNPIAVISDSSCVYSCATLVCEDFDSGIGNWTNNGWTVSTLGTTPSFATGPQAGDPNTTGQFMFYETSGLSSVSPAVTLTSECLDISALAAPALQFNYHMYGAAMGTLNVYVNGNLEWTMSGDQGNQWNATQVDLSAYIGSNVDITFEGNYGTSYTSDMAIDNVCIAEMGSYGCTDSTAFNYDPTAAINDGSCVPVIVGCMDPGSLTYDPAANTSDPLACLYGVYGCIDMTACNYNASATLDDGSCDYISCYGCIDSTAINYDASMLYDDGSCLYCSLTASTVAMDETSVGALNGAVDLTVSGTYCTTGDSLQSDMSAGGTSNGSGGVHFDIINTSGQPVTISGFGQGAITTAYAGTKVMNVWTMPGQYNETTTIGWTQVATSVTTVIPSVAESFGPIIPITPVVIPAGATQGFYVGVATGTVSYMTATAFPAHTTYMSDANISITSGHGGVFGNGTNTPRAPYLRVHYGDPNASASTFVWSNGATTEDLTNLGYGTYNVTITDCYGCTTTASATVGVSVTTGCTDALACNYDAAANTDDGSCTYPGCTDTLSCDYDPIAGCDDGSCTYPAPGYDCNGNCIAANACQCDALCNSNFTNVNDEHITNVTFAGINNTSAGITGGPVNYTGLTGATVIQGSTESISVTLFNSASYTEHIHAWCDWNQNGDFSDPGEYYLVAASVTTVGPHTASVTVPTTALTGTTRMRVMVAYGTSGATPDPCLSATYGEAEDYCVTVNALTVVLGCTDPIAINYDPLANTDDGSCTYVLGCTDPTASNYDPAATQDDGSCTYVSGCTDATAQNYDPAATQDDGSCIYAGCLDALACNYNAIATIDDGSCNYGAAAPIFENFDSYPISGTLASGAPATIGTWTNSYSGWSTTTTNAGWLVDNNGTGSVNTGPADDITGGGNYIYFEASSPAIVGAQITLTSQCIDISTLNSPCLDFDYSMYGSTMGTLDVIVNGTNVWSITGDQGTGWYAAQVSLAAFSGAVTIEFVGTRGSGFYGDMAIDDISINECGGVIAGCTDPLAINYDATATIDNGSCIYPMPGCTDPTACNYDALASVDDGSCDLPFGCGDVLYLEYDPAVTCSDAAACATLIVYGCTDPTAINHDPTASIDDGSCIYPINGCTNPAAFNYNPNANTDDGSCILAGCTDPAADNYDASATVDDGSCTYTTVSGCTDPAADNYDASATVDDGSCTYTASSCAGSAITGLSVSDIIHDRAVFNFDNMNTYDGSGAQICRVDQIRIKYREVGTSSWSQKNMASPTGYDAVTGVCNSTQNTSKLVLSLSGSSTYEWQVKVWYCDGQNTGWSNGPDFTTLGSCPNVGNLAVTTPLTTKATFTWDASNGSYSFVRLKARPELANPQPSDWFTIGGAGVAYGTNTKNKNGLTPGQDYRGQARTWCDPNGGPYRATSWTSLIYWTQPTSVRLEGGDVIANLDVYPNPSRDVFNVTFTSEDVQDLEVRLVNIVGEIVYTENLQQFVGEYTKSIDLATYTKGVYFLEITTGNGVVNKKLILQ